MRVLIVKTSSLGDVIHTLPALTDAGRIHPDIRFDWVVEQSFSEIPAWHPLVDNVIPMAWRRWRKNIFSAQTWSELKQFYGHLRSKKYDLVIDAQGLIKSAVVTRLSKGVRCGLDYASAWESLASLAYQRRCTVNPEQHAVTRMRQLFAEALDYIVPKSVADYGLVERESISAHEKSLVFLHGTTWTTKLWPEGYWIEIAKYAILKMYNVILPWGNEQEKQRAERIAAAVSSDRVQVLPPLNLVNIGGILMKATAIVAVDTGLGHLSAAFSIPTVSLYGPTNPVLTGTCGKNQYHLSSHFPPCSPCLQRECTYTGPAAAQPACLGALTPELVWEKLQNVMEEKKL